MTDIPRILLSVLEDIEPLMQRAFDAVGGSPEPGSALDQAYLIDGREVVVDYLEHGEAGIALDHLAYMIVEADLPISPDTRRRLLEAASAMGSPEGTWQRLAGG